MMAVLPRQDLSKRDEDDFDNWDGNNNWYWSDVCRSLLFQMFNSPLTVPQEVRTIKYGTLLGILLVSFLVILGMWFHADQRMKKGLPPLRYHRVRILLPKIQLYRCARDARSNFPVTNRFAFGLIVVGSPEPESSMGAAASAARTTILVLSTKPATRN